MKEKTGFTLIELLVAMGIIGLLATLGMGNYINVKKKGRDAQRKHDLEQTQRALEIYYNDYGEYPSPVFPGVPGKPWQDVNGTLYIKTIPLDPKGYSYLYQSADGSSYKIFAYLENDQDSDIQTCIVSYGYFCVPSDASLVCNYGVSSVNLRVCD